MGKFVDLTGQKFGKLIAIKYIGNQRWVCKCDCGGEKVAISRRLRNGKTRDCGCESVMNFIDLTGQQFGEWKVLYYTEKSFWMCRCSCGVEQEVHSYSLRSGNSLSCGHVHGKKRDLTNQVFGELTALYYLGNRKWMCRCSCGKEYPVGTYDLTSGHSKSCGHSTNKFQDLRGKKIWYLTPLEYIGDGYWRCQCDCGNTKDVKGEHLRNGLIRSCGCMKENIRKKSMLDKYGELCTWNKQPRSLDQIHLIQDREGLLSTILAHNIENRQITPSELAKLLGVTLSTALRTIHRFELESYVDLSKHKSSMEIEIGNFIESFGCKVVYQDKGILNGLELDIYIPSKKLAIEFNGSYWHSDIYKDKKYHQQKTIDCAKQGIHLIHIFEYEWNDATTRDKICRYISNLFNHNVLNIYARNTHIKELNKNQSKEFLDLNHLQGYANSCVNIGCYLDEKLIGVMTFGKPRFNNRFEWEIIRFCWKNDVKVIGGAEKLFNYFLKHYKPTSIITYVDISKFTGNIYTRLGFKPIQPNPITEPNYIWIDTQCNKVLTRYQTQKHKLIEMGLGTEDQTEDEIMSSLGYIKIYDSGNLKLEWLKGEQ